MSRHCASFGAVLLCSCHAILPFGAWVPHDGTGVDVARGEQSRTTGPKDASGAGETGWNEAGVPGPDTAPTDASAVPVDLDAATPRDLASEGDLGAAVADQSPATDVAGPADQGSISSACNEPNASPYTQPSGWNASKIQICFGTSVDQCNAASLCNTVGGWHLCTAQEYKDAGGAQHAANVGAWLAACIRNGAGVISPLTSPTAGQICSACTKDKGGSVVVGYDCRKAGMTTSASALYVGLATSNECLRAGVNDEEHEAYWHKYATDEKRDYAACCHD